MDAKEFAAEELRRVEEIKKDKTLQAMIRTRDTLIQRLQRELRWLRYLAVLLGVTIVTLIMMLWI